MNRVPIGVCPSEDLRFMHHPNGKRDGSYMLTLRVEHGTQKNYHLNDDLDNPSQYQVN